MILSDKYKKAMDSISLTEEQKQKIIQNAKKKKFDYRVIVNIAACLVVIAVVYGALQNKIEPDSPNKYSTDSVVVETTEKSSESTTEKQESTQAVESTTEITTTKSVEKNTEMTTARKIYEKNAVAKREKSSTTLADNKIKKSDVETTTEKITQADKLYMTSLNEDNEVAEQSIDSIEGEPMLKTASSPYVEYNSVDELKENVNINAKIPDKIRNYKSYSYSVAFSNMAEIQYSNGSDNILYRLEKGEVAEDISGDYNDYENIQKLTVDNTEVTIKGNEDTYKVAIWYKNGVNYSLSSEQGLKIEDIQSLINELM
jgi:hypothetical protein